MPLFFLLVGVLLVIVGINDRVSDLVTLLKDDFAPSDGQPSFILWILIIGAVGLLGGIKSLKPVSNAFLLLLVIVVLLGNRGFIGKFTDALKSA
jgi:hypothetical protein